ncbi:hypothetical protein CBM2599_A120493 [Cupriavidus taiwanensis]|nr:hypothetical protein [Cupriavidus taiwanensis]SOY79928.1 hypothetical protein CBM2599_A120493 [Cupriavidus taiwanensis]SOY81897.1 hypothetical protein CBM2600_A120515 [Cupriavidus taiwanensis]
MPVPDRRLTVLTGAALDAAWQVVAPLLDKALAHSEAELTSTDIRDLAAQGLAFVLVIMRDNDVLAAGAFEIVQYPRYKAANIIAVGGRRVFLRRDELAWLQMLARDMGCVKVQTYCRPSMARLLERLGMREAYRVMRCDL